MTDLAELLRQAAQIKMTPDQIEAQRQSWARGMTQGCEHGVLDYETCPECRRTPPPPGDKADGT